MTLSQAEPVLGRSLHRLPDFVSTFDMTSSPTTPHLSQLAFQLSQDGRHDQALDLLKRANQSEPANPFLAVNLGFCALAAGQVDEASTALERAEALFSRDQLATVSVLERLCHGWLLAQHPGRAHALLERHAPLGSSPSQALIALYASVVTALGDPNQALQWFGQLTDPSHRDSISASLSSLLIRQGRLQDAEQVLVQSPGTGSRADLVTNLAILASEHGKVARARTFYLQARELEPQSFVPAFNLARFYFLQGDSERAHAAVTEALHLAPQAREGYQLLEQIESGRGDFDSALAVIGQWLKVHPNDLAAQIAECRIHVTTGDHARLTQRLPQLVGRCPGHPDLLGLLAGLPRDLRRQQGLSESVLRCFEPDSQVRHHSGLVPESLCHQLAQRILEDPTLHGHRPHKPSRQGSQTHEVFTDPLPPELSALVTLLQPHLDAMIAGFNEEQRRALAYPLSSQSLRFSGWGVVLETGGYQAPHVHPESLFSGVVYLRMPAPEEAPDPSSPAPGSLCFYGDGVQSSADPDSPSQSNPSPATDSRLPANGDLILFPSFLWHGTVPFSAAGPRICLAFNVLPELTQC